MMQKKQETHQDRRHPFKTALIVLLVLFLAANLFAFMISGFSPEQSFGNVAHITITGPIVGDSEAGFFSSGVASSTDVVDLLEKAAKDSEVKAVLLEINSPGGSAVASAEIASAVDDLRQQNKTVVAWIREVGASGAYWVAASSSHIIAHELSMTGSVGVFSSYLEFSGLMENYNVTYERLVAGQYKDMGSPFRELTSPEKAIFQSKLDKVQDVFLNDVAKKRSLTEQQKAEVSNGLFYLGMEAKALNLVDELGGKKEALAYLEEKLGEEVQLKEYSTQKSIWQRLNLKADEKAFYIGKGIGSALVPENSRMRAELR